MKVGREEVLGMLVAIERWVNGDLAAEWAGWVRQDEVIAAAADLLTTRNRASRLPGRLAPATVWPATPASR
jgi:hypothetical protein